MELKLECLDASVRFKVLLIVPYGIEMMNRYAADSPYSLLIVPYGIEMNALFYLIQDL